MKTFKTPKTLLNVKWTCIINTKGRNWKEKKNPTIKDEGHAAIKLNTTNLTYW